MAVRSHTSISNLQLLRQIAGPARSASWLIWLSAAVLYATKGQCLRAHRALRNQRARRDRQASGQLPSHCQPLLHNPHLYPYCIDNYMSYWHTLLPWCCPFAALCCPSAAFLPPFADFANLAMAGIPATQPPIARSFSASKSVLAAADATYKGVSLRVLQARQVCYALEHYHPLRGLPYLNALAGGPVYFAAFH